MPPLSFKPIRLLIAYDPARGHCGLVVPRMKKMLEDRAFTVDVHEIDGSPVDLADYSAVIFGTPMPGVGLRRSGPTEKVEQFIAGLEGLDEKKFALFCVYDVGFGTTFDRLKNLLMEKGAEYVAEHPYWRLRPQDGEHILPAECMIRIRS